MTAHPSFSVGDKLVYPRHGVAEVTGLERQEIAGTSLECYVLRVLENNMTVWVPKQNTKAVGLRRLVSQEQVDAVFETLRRRGEKISTATWNRRAREYNEKISTGSLVEIATVLRDLCLLRVDKDLSFGEKKMLETARSLLVQEIAMATGKDTETMGAELDAIFVPAG